MSLYQSIQATNRMPIPSANTATDLVPVVATFVVPAGLAVGDIIEMGPLQAGYVPVDLTVAFPKADSNGTPTVKFDAGMLSGNWLDPNTPTARTIGSEFFAADTNAQAGGVARMNKPNGAQIAPVSNDRSWGLKVNTAAATLVAGITITATMLARPRIEGV